MVDEEKRQKLINIELNDIFNKRIWQAPFDEVLVPVGFLNRLYIGPSFTRPYLAYWQPLEDEEGYRFVDSLYPGDPGYYNFKKIISSKTEKYFIKELERELEKVEEKANRPKTLVEKIKLFFGFSI